MKPIPFSEANFIFTRPKGMSEDECSDLHVHETAEGEFISKWEPTEEEREAIARGEPVWLRVLGCRAHPPVSVSTDYPFTMVILQ
jgi:hypothetical protein